MFSGLLIILVPLIVGYLIPLRRRHGGQSFGHFGIVQPEFGF